VFTGLHTSPIADNECTAAKPLHCTDITLQPELFSCISLTIHQNRKTFPIKVAELNYVYISRNAPSSHHCGAQFKIAPTVCPFVPIDFHEILYWEVL
jgi:hypothetical protein